MKTLLGIDKEITELAEQLDDLTGSKKKKVQKRIDFLKTMRNYLEAQNSEPLFKAQRKKLKALIDSKKGQYNYWKINLAPRNVDTKKLPAMFNKEIGLDRMKKQLKTLDFILS